MRSNPALLFVAMALAAFFAAACTDAPLGPEETHVQWLEEQSISLEAQRLTDISAGNPPRDGTDPITPRPIAAVKQAPVWLSVHPAAIMTLPASVTRPTSMVTGSPTAFTTLADSLLWGGMEDIGFRAMHAASTHRTGEIRGTVVEPSPPGVAAEVSLGVAPSLGGEQAYAALAGTAARHHGVLVGDILSWRTGKGADFRLAELGFQDYPDLYRMVAVEKSDWGLLPDVPKGAESAPLTQAQARGLTEKGYALENSQENAQANALTCPSKSNATLSLAPWDATAGITGVDSQVRRWVYSHNCDPRLPLLGWLASSFGAQRILAADAGRTLGAQGALGARLSGSPYSTPAYTPAETAAIHATAWTAREAGGFLLLDANLSLDTIAALSAQGPDLFRDRLGTTAALHAIMTGDASFLRLVLQLQDKFGLEPSRFIHGLQHEDGFGAGLAHFAAHADKSFDYKGKRLDGAKLRRRILDELLQAAKVPWSAYNKTDPDRVFATTAGLLAGTLDIPDPYSATPEQLKAVTQGHLLLAAFNALRPGVFSLSGRDLVGTLPLQDASQDTKDFRPDLGAYDLMDLAPDGKKSPAGLSMAHALYGPLPRQLIQAESFAFRLKQLLASRHKLQLALAQQTALLSTKGPGTIFLAHTLPDGLGHEITALNFSRKSARETVELSAIPGLDAAAFKNKPILDTLSGKTQGVVRGNGKLVVTLEGWEAKTLLLPGPKMAETPPKASPKISEDTSQATNKKAPASN
jgi:trehalose synthase